MFGLPERLAASGLRYRCLFKGQAQRDFGDSGPHLVELLPGHPFTRLLFTQSQRTTGAIFWSAQIASFLVSPLGLEALLAQLRLYTLILDEQTGRRMFFRFYALEVLRTVVAGLPAARLAEMGRGIRRFLCHHGRDGAFILERDGAATSGRINE